MSMSLFDVCQRGSSEQLQWFIDQKMDTSQVDEHGRSALHYCCDQSNMEGARVLLRDKSTSDQILNRQDREGCSALHLACMNGNGQLVRLLCEHGADVQLVDNESHSLIHWATVCGHLHLLDILVEFKASVHTADMHGAYPIHYASQLSGLSDHDEFKIDPEKGLAILQKLIDHHAEIDCIDERKRTPLMWAASAGAKDALRILYKYGANQMHADKESLTALHCAATGGHTSCIRMLVEQCGCPLEREDINSCTALFYAVTLNHPEAVHLILELHANPNHRDTRGRTPSHCAVVRGNLDSVKYLLQFRANMWMKNKRGDCPVHEAIQSRSHSSTPEQEDKDRQKRINIFAILRYLFDLYPEHIHIRNDERRTPLHLAASLGEIDTCQLLLECGARIHSLIRTSAGNYLTPYDLARIRRHDACAEYLAYHHGGQRGNLLVNVLVRRIQRYFRRSRLSKETILAEYESTPLTTTQIQSLDRSVDLIDTSTIKTKSKLSKQAKLCVQNKEFDDRFKAQSLNIQSSLASASKLIEADAQERRRIFAKSRTTIKPIHDSAESKLIIHSSASTTTVNKLNLRRQLIAEELLKLKQARLQNHYIIINRALYKILIETAFNPQSRRAEEIENYLETLIISYDKELEALRRRTQSVPPKLHRRPSQWF